MHELSGAAPSPAAEDVRSRLSRLDPPPYAAGARLLLVKPVGLWPSGPWRPGADVALHAIFALPAGAYLGLCSWCDEYEQLDEGEDFTLDLVAFEVEKVARLVLKGHRPTLDWLASGAGAVLRLDEAAAIEVIAAQRAEQLAVVDPLTSPPPAPPAVYEQLDAWVRAARRARA